MLTDNEIKDIIKVTTTVESGGMFWKKTTEKTF